VDPEEIAIEILDALESAPTIGPWVKTIRSLVEIFGGDHEAMVLAMRETEIAKQRARDLRMFGDDS